MNMLPPTTRQSIRVNDLYRCADGVSLILQQNACKTRSPMPGPFRCGHLGGPDLPSRTRSQTCRQRHLVWASQVNKMAFTNQLRNPAAVGSRRPHMPRTGRQLG
jgi:hypothetical protein